MLGQRLSESVSGPGQGGTHGVDRDLEHLGDRLDIALDDPKLIPGIKSDLRNTHLRVTLPDNLFVEDHSKMTSKGLDVLTVIAEEFLPFTEKVRLGVTSHYKTVKAEYGLHIPGVAAKRRLRAFEAAFGKRIARGGKQDVFEYHGVPVADQAPRAYPYTSDENSRIILMFKAK